MSPSSWSGAVLASVISAVLIEVARICVDRTRADLVRRNPITRRILLAGVAVVVLGINLYMWYWLGEWYPLFFVVSSLVLGRLIWKEINQFWQVGLTGADRQVVSGLNYGTSLKLCTNSLDFLGIGASKLVREGEAFADAINRCHRDTRAIRFLLCNPDNADLIRMAKQAGRETGEYQRTVRDAIQTLAKFRVERERNIEVRFYNRLPLFRLMFIDESFCLASHYVFGEGDGSQLPQLHVVRSVGPHRRDVESLYFPLQQYFEQLWEESTPWDFKP